MKQQRKITKKVMAFLLAVAMIVTSFPFLSHEVYAADNVLPDNTQFATAAQLKSFNTETDGSSAKVYFGWNSETNTDLQWWIAGSKQENGLTLFAASPLTWQAFERNWNGNKTYINDWNCNYPDGEPTEVSPNHYGASPLRTTLRNFEDLYFTSSEKNLMNETIIHTNDFKNKKNYSTREKLYLAYGNLNDDYITVGTNSTNSLNNGLRIDTSYWGNNGVIWLRAPSVNPDYGSMIVLAAVPNSQIVDDWDVYFKFAVVPAFEFNLSSVLFASTATAASSDGALSTNDAFTLRYDTDNLGSAQVSYDKSQVNLSKVPNGIYLVVQNSNGAIAKAVSGTTSVSASDMNLDNFENCKVWLETTDTTNRMTYATMAKESQGHNINVIGNDTLKVTNGMQEVVPGAEIFDITVKAENGYYFTDEYVSNLNNQLNSLIVTKTDNYNLKISGTPTSDVIITLPSATQRPKADTPEITTIQTASSITVNELTETNKFGAAEYSLNGTDWQDSNVFENLSANTEYTVFARYKGKDIYIQSEAGTIRTSTVPATYEIMIPMTAAADDTENTISIENTDNFDLGYNGKVNVKIKDTDTMNNGVLSLTREHGNNETITSQLLVGGNPFTDLSQNVATFTNKDDTAVPFVFKRPTNTNILAGTYKGTVVFDISYNEN